MFGFRNRKNDAVVSESATGPTFDSDGRAIPAATGGADSDNAGDDNSAIASGVDQLQKFRATHQWDYNLDYDDIERVNKTLQSGDVEKEANLEHTLLETDSPYFEVRAAVRNYDE